MMSKINSRDNRGMKKTELLQAESFGRAFSKARGD